MNVVTSASAYNDGNWHQAVAGRISGSGIFLYSRRRPVASNGTTTSRELSRAIGAPDMATCHLVPLTSPRYFLNGTLDEVWVSHTEISADFIKLVYETQKPNSTVLTYPNTGPSDWAYNTKVYVNTTATGANSTSDVTQFPAAGAPLAANFNFSQANSDGSDLRFADTAGNLLAYEIERFDATNKAAEVWVLLPTVNGNNNSQWFKMYWGKGTATSLSSGSSVFLTPDGFSGVWHMGEDGNTTAGGYRMPPPTGTMAPARPDQRLGRGRHHRERADLDGSAPG